MGTHHSLATLALTIAFVAGFSPVVRAQDPSAYRGFRLGMTVLAVATEAGVPPAAAQVVYQRPLLIEELEWRLPAVKAPDATARPDTVARILFGFCNGELYRIVVSYDPERTEGLTDQDLIEALSAEYGPARTPVGRIITSPASRAYTTDSEAVTARWEDAHASVNLFQVGYRSAFGLVIYSKKLAPVARAGIEQGRRSAELDAPRRELAEQTAREDNERAAHAKARAANKAAFRF